MSRKPSKVHPTQGFQQTPVILAMRWVSQAIASILRLHGKSRWSNEFIQSLDPSMSVSVPEIADDPADVLWFRTGHGRLFWRVSETPGLEKITNKWIASFAQEDVFFDVGANIGLYSMAASKYRHARTIAFEPDLMNARLLYENILVNQLSRVVTVLPVALDSASKLGEFHLKTLSYGDALHNLGSPSRFARRTTGFVASVPVFTLDDIVRILRLPTATRIKIDVDGREIAVLAGATETLKTVKDVLVEVDLDSIEASELERLMVDHGFSLVLESEPHVSWNRCVERLYSRLGE